MELVGTVDTDVLQTDHAFLRAIDAGIYGKKNALTYLAYAKFLAICERFVCVCVCVCVCGLLLVV